MCEQQGDRIKNYHKPEASGLKFVPSKFAMMLMYEDKEKKEFQLVESKFDSHFKLSMMFRGTTLKPGRYIIMVAPQWHESAFIE